MNTVKMIAAAAVISVAGTAATAGGMAPVMVEAPVVVMDEPMAPAGSINPGFIVLGLLAALVAASGSF